MVSKLPAQLHSMAEQANRENDIFQANQWRIAYEQIIQRLPEILTEYAASKGKFEHVVYATAYIHEKHWWWNMPAKALIEKSSVWYEWHMMLEIRDHLRSLGFKSDIHRPVDGKSWEVVASWA